MILPTLLNCFSLVVLSGSVLGEEWWLIADFCCQEVPNPLSKILHRYSPSFTKVELVFGRIDYWDTSRVTDFSFAFYHNYLFNRSLERWNTSRARTMQSMFESATSFNQPLSTWNTSQVQSMDRMFAHATYFNQSLETWDLSSVQTSIGSMFTYAISFQGLIGQDVGVLRTRPGARELFQVLERQHGIHPFYRWTKHQERDRIEREISKNDQRRRRRLIWEKECVFG